MKIWIKIVLREELKRNDINLKNMYWGIDFGEKILYLCRVF